jgi:uncharacterized protein
MNLPLEGELARWLAIPFGMAFGYVLHRSRVADYDVIVNQFRLRDSTMMKIMLTAIFIGGVGVFALHNLGLAQYHIKPSNLIAVSLGASIFAVGMVLLGYCPGTSIAAMAGGSMHALIGFLGMIAGGVLYGLSYPWVEKNIQPLAALGKLRLPDLTGIPDLIWFLALATLPAFGYAFSKMNGGARADSRPDRELSSNANSTGKSPAEHVPAWDI